MSERDRFGDFAPYAVISVGLLLVGLVAFELASNREQARYEQQRAYDYARHAKADIDSTCRGLDSAAQTICIREIIESTNEHQRSERDLSAQQSMARWALWMIVVTGFSVIATAIGIYFVWRTLVANTDAVRIARAANKITQDESCNSLRAYAYVSNAFIEWDGRRPKISLEFVNAGQTPATDAGFRFIVTRGDPDQGIPILIADERWKAVPYLVRDPPAPVSVTIDVAGGITANKAVVDAILGASKGEEPKRINVTGKLHYKTLFNETWEIPFAFFAVVNPSTKSQRMNQGIPTGPAWRMTTKRNSDNQEPT